MGHDALTPMGRRPLEGRVPTYPVVFRSKLPSDLGSEKPYLVDLKEDPEQVVAGR
jgi:hypothetical protein